SRRGTRGSGARERTLADHVSGTADIRTLEVPRRDRQTLPRPAVQLRVRDGRRSALLEPGRPNTVADQGARTWHPLRWRGRNAGWPRAVLLRVPGGRCCREQGVYPGAARLRAGRV